MKLSSKILLAILTFFFVVIPATLSLIVQLPSVQTKLSQEVVRVVSNKLNGEISISNIYYALFGRIVIEDVALLDNNRDTLLSSKKVSLSFSPIELTKRHVKIEKVILTDGLINVVHTSDSTINILEVFPKQEEKEIVFNMAITAKKLQLKDFKVNYLNPYGKEPLFPVTGHTMDFRDLHFSDFNLDVRDIRYNDLNGRATVAALSLQEARGFKIENVSFEATLNNFGIMIKKLNYKDSFSNIALDHVYALTDDFSQIENIFEDITLDAQISDKSFFDCKTVQALIPGLEYIDLQILVKGSVFGTIKNLDLDNFKVYSPSKRSMVSFSAHFNGLPVLNETMASIRVNDCYTDFKDISWILNSVSKYPISGIAELAPGHILTFKGSLNGLLDDYVAYGVIDSPGLGSLNIDAICRNEMNLGLEVLGMMNTNGLNVGEIIQAKNIGMLAFDATATIFAAINPDQSYVSLDNLYISRLDFNDYSYSGITAAGNLEPTGFVGQVQSTDPNFKFDFDGVVSFPSHEEENTYNFTLDVDNIDLVALNFDKERNGNINLSANANFVLSKDKELNGKFVIDSIHYTVGDVPYSLDKIEILSQRSSDNVTTASLMSSFLKGTVKTNASAIDDILTDLRRQILLQHLSHLTDEESRNSIGSYASGNWYDIKFATGDLRPIFAFLKPDLHVDKGTSLDIHVDEYGNMNGKILSELIALGNIFIKGLDVSLTNDMNDLKSTVYSEIIQYGNIKTYSDTIHLNLRENVADVTLSYNNHDSLANKGLFNTAIALYDKQNGKNPIGVTLYDSFIKFYENTWLLDKASVNYSENHVAVDNFNLHNGNQSLTIDGMMTESIGDTCKVLLNNFDVGILNSFLGLDFLSHGNATGYVSIVAPFSMFDLDGDIDIDSLSLAGCYMGDFCIKSDWVEENELVNFSVTSDIDDLNPLNVAGSFSPEKKEVDAKVSLENLNIGFIEPILTGLMENISGSISGDIEISGPLNNLSVKSSDCHIDDMHTTLSFTKVPYTVNGVFNLDEKGVNVKNIDIRDQFSGYGTMTGKVTYDHFKDIALDLNMRLNNLHGVNTTILDSPIFYGQAFASGNIHIGGLINAIELALRLTTEPNTSIHIPLSSNGKEQASVITFVSDTKPVYNSYDSLINLRRTIAEEAVSKSGMKVNLQMDITQDADVMIEINRTTGDIIRSKGVGYVDINLENENLDIKGDYSINEGNYRFGMLSIVTRDFTITPGSKINFVGDVMDSEFDVEAIYRTKASIAALVSDSTSVTSRRPVNCAIDLTGKLSDLNIDFNIDLPDIDPIYEDVIMGALNTEEKRLKQFMALLVSNSFLPDEQSGINERANVSFLNASEILSNQLSTILNELDIPVDLGFNYQTGITGTNLFDVAISTQLFNNRVSINGNFGNREQLSSSSQHSDLVGDIDVEIKVDKNGKVRVTLFSHSGDILSSYLDNSQRNGVGIALQEDFNTFRELLRNIFWSKKRRAEYDRQVREGQMEEAARTTSPPIILKSSKK